LNQVGRRNVHAGYSDGAPRRRLGDIINQPQSLSRIASSFNESAKKGRQAAEQIIVQARQQPNLWNRDRAIAQLRRREFG
jgi:hypothetical protein